MESPSGELTAKIQAFESKLLEKSTRTEFSLLASELVLRIKTLEIELKAERKRSEALRQNLRTLASAAPPSTTKPGDTLKSTTSTAKKPSNVAPLRYLEEARDFNLTFKSFRDVPSSGSESARAVPQTARAALPEHRSGSSTSMSTRSTNSASNPNSTAPPLRHVKANTLRSYQPESRPKDSTFQRSSALPTIGDANYTDDESNGEEFHPSRPDASSSHPPSDAHTSSATTSPTKSSSNTLLKTTRDTSSALPRIPLLNDSASAPHLPHHIEIPVDRSESEKLSKSAAIEQEEVPQLTETDISASVDPADGVSSPNAVLSAATSPRSMEDYGSGEDEPRKVDAAWLTETLRAALLEGLRQKNELAKMKTSALAQNLQASSSSSSLVQSDSVSSIVSSHSSSPVIQEKPTSTKVRSKSLKRLKSKSTAVLVSHPVGLKVGSYRAEQDELERIFYLTKDFVDRPSPLQRSEEAKFPEALRKKLGILKESLEFDVDFSACELLALPPFVMDYVCKTSRFNLSDNRLSEIPNQIRKFDKLEELYLANNVLVRIPVALSHLRCLTTLALNNNKIMEIPVDLVYLTQLEFLDLSENQIVEIPKALGCMTSLRRFLVSKNPITSLPAELALCSNLTHLEASMCFLRKVPKELANLNQLEVLDLSHNNLKDLPPHIGLLHRLRSLHVQHNQLNDLPLSLGLCSLLMTTGTLDIHPNPWNPKTFATVISGDTNMVDVLLQRVLENQKALSKLQPHQPPKAVSIPPFKPLNIDTERWTLAEKILCCGDWISHTMDTYLKPFLSSMYTSLKEAKELEIGTSSSEASGFDGPGGTTGVEMSPELSKLISQVLAIKTIIWRYEDLLKPSSTSSSSSSFKLPPSDDDSPLGQIKTVIGLELVSLDGFLRSLITIIRSAAITERLEDIVIVVDAVHFVRDLLFTLVLDEQKGPSLSPSKMSFKLSLAGPSKSASASLISPNASSSAIASSSAADQAISATLAEAEEIPLVHQIASTPPPEAVVEPTRVNLQ